MRKALIVGINYYDHISGLGGCVNDAHQVQGVLERHANGNPNFGVKLLTSSDKASALGRHQLKEAIRELFAYPSEIALLYFAGHGYIDTNWGYLCASDTKSGDDGVPLSEVVDLANQSKATNKVIVLDSCHSGIAGNTSSNRKVAEIWDGMTVLTASTADQYATEKNGGGVFTSLFVDALSGAAANLLGEITPGSVYAHVDQSLGPWMQRPVFKTNVETFVSLRKVSPPVPQDELRRIAEFFPTPGFVFKLDPSYEPERHEGDEKKSGYIPPDPKKTSIFRILQKFNRVNLVVPIDAPHMYHAAMESKACKLTATGEHYRRLVKDGLI
jgi:hypothetical protein